jgi:hypothetical protein
MPAACQFAHPTFFLLILGRSHSQDLRHVLAPSFLNGLPSYFITF